MKANSLTHRSNSNYTKFILQVPDQSLKGTTPQQTKGQSQLCASMCWEESTDSHQDCRDKEEKSK